MTNGLDRLLKAASESIVSTPSHAEFDAFGDHGRELADLLRRRNGFYAFESALLVRPASPSSIPRSIEEWNTPTLWRKAYEIELPPLLYFAEDAFGGQFALTEEGIVSIDPETGEVEDVGKTLADWAAGIMDDYEYLTGYPLAHDWQVDNGPLPAGKRLVPKTPFVCEGEFAVDNLSLLDDVVGMQLRGQLATQLVDVPDGTSITFRISD